eukprot:1211015-Amphidinium_carterae.1
MESNVNQREPLSQHIEDVSGIRGLTFRGLGCRNRPGRLTASLDIRSGIDKAVVTTAMLYQSGLCKT